MPDLRVPQYHRIFLILRERIADGTFPPGTMLPGEHKLAEIFSVSRITVRRALDELARNALVTREQGRGTQVRELVADAVLDGTLDSLGESNRLIGRAKVRILDLRIVHPPPDAARALALDVSERVCRIERIRSVAGTPFCHVTAYVPESIGREITRKSLERDMLITLLERSGQPVAGARQTVSATIAEPYLAEVLGTETGAPLLRIARTVHSVEGRRVEYAVILFRPDLYRMEMSLERGEAAGEEDHAGTDGAFRLSA